MNLRLLPPLVSAMLLLGSRQGRAQQSPPIFRYIALSPTDSIILGRPFAPKQLADKVESHTYELRTGTFGGAERIRIIVDSAGRVTSMEFQYAGDVTFDSTVKGYIGSLGRPSSLDTLPAHRLAVWGDASTRFVVTEVLVGGHRVVSSRIVDKVSRQ